MLERDKRLQSPSLYALVKAIWGRRIFARSIAGDLIEEQPEQNKDRM